MEDFCDHCNTQQRILASPSKVQPDKPHPAVWRIVERLIKEKLARHLLSDNVIEKGQHGFKNLSHATCMTNGFDLIIVVANDESKRDRFLDSTKAFVRVFQSRLLSAVTSYGITDSFKFWLLTYLTSGSQTHYANNCSRPQWGDSRPSSGPDIVSHECE